jgi:FtsH-binding integral membrane protein
MKTKVTWLAVTLGTLMGMVIGFGIIFIIMTIGRFIFNNVIIDYRYWLYFGIFFISLLGCLFVKRKLDKMVNK